jgi:hypothetical protein
MWNAWLDLDVTEQDYELEVIEGVNAIPWFYHGS